LPQPRRRFWAAPAVAQQVVRIPRDWLPSDVEVKGALPAGTIYATWRTPGSSWAWGDGMARRYKIAVGAPGRNFRGEAYVARKAEWPSWVPTRE
jgi:lipoprotein-anchoring transpeptidase ErfK/SrfK